MSQDEILPIAKLIEELRHEEPNIRLRAINELPLIAMALGAERVREELIPYISGTIDNEKICLAIISGLKQLLPFIGGLDHVYCILNPLETICCTSENNVRDAAVEAIESIARKLTSKNHINYVKLVIERLMSSLSLPSRIASIVLLSNVIDVFDEAVQAELMEKYMAQIVRSETQSLKKWVAGSLSTLCVKLSSPAFDNTLLSIFQIYSGVDIAPEISSQLLKNFVNYKRRGTFLKEHLWNFIVRESTTQNFLLRTSIFDNLEHMCGWYYLTDVWRVLVRPMLSTLVKMENKNFILDEEILMQIITSFLHSAYQSISSSALTSTSSSATSVQPEILICEEQLRESNISKVLLLDMIESIVDTLEDIINNNTNNSTGNNNMSTSSTNATSSASNGLLNNYTAYGNDSAALTQQHALYNQLALCPIVYDIIGNIKQYIPELVTAQNRLKKIIITTLSPTSGSTDMMYKVLTTIYSCLSTDQFKDSLSLPFKDLYLNKSLSKSIITDKKKNVLNSSMHDLLIPYYILSNAVQEELLIEISNMIEGLVDNNNWRLRELALSFLLKIIERNINPSPIYVKILLMTLKDPVYVIRMKVVDVIVYLTQLFGEEWFITSIYDELETLAVCNNYIYRYVVLITYTNVIEVLNNDSNLVLRLLKSIIRMLTDKVPNIRFNAIKCLSQLNHVIKLRSNECALDIKNAWDTLTIEKDPDVNIYKDKYQNDILPLVK